VVGLLLLLPPTRAIFRGLVGRMARRRATLGPRIVFFGGGSRRPSPPTYDVEGSAREVDEPEPELPPGERDGQ
jgi:hypothetical protein